MWATEINEAMKLALALAELAKKPVPDIVNMAYSNANLIFGKDYIIPKPVDPRLITTVAPAVPGGYGTGVAGNPITDWAAYELELARRLGNDNTISRIIETKARAGCQTGRFGRCRTRLCAQSGTDRHRRKNCPPDSAG